ncbi:MAG TPA: inosine-5-monophosphate dehydrogenase, partial [Methanobacterium sp.]|nr:inosine-5-monophosphate dehydrogenase [Methanobacterium sp.]
TSSDVLMVSPELTEILVEDARMQNQAQNGHMDGSYPVPGSCEGCGNFMDDLVEIDGKFLCEDCIER